MRFRTWNQKTHKKIHWTEWVVVLSFGKDGRKFGVIGNSTRYPMMCSVLDNGKDFYDLHALLEKCYLELGSVLKQEAAMKFSFICPVRSLGSLAALPVTYPRLAPALSPA